MAVLRMAENDYASLAKLEDAFDRKDLSHFVKLLESPPMDLPLLLRVHAVCMMEHIGDESVVQTLCAVLKGDPSPLTRHETAFTLGQLGYASAVQSLVEAMLKDESPIVRHESAVALSSIGDQGVLPELEKAIADKDEDASNSALIAFEYLSYLKRKASTFKEASVKPKIRL